MTSVSVILLSIFLAVSVDKLSEVQQMKKDISMRTEQQQEMRKERREQLDALKNAKDFSIISSTLYRLVKFYSILQSQQHSQHQRQHLKKQHHRKERMHSLQIDVAPQVLVEKKRANYRKAISSPDYGPMSFNFDDEEMGVGNASPELTSTSSYQNSGVIKTSMKNPLTRFQRSFEEAEERRTAVKRHLSGDRSEHNSSSPPGSSVASSHFADDNMSTLPSSSSLGSSVFGWKQEDFSMYAQADFGAVPQELYKSVKRHSSVQSEPSPTVQSTSSPKLESLEYMRSQSLPPSGYSFATQPLDDHEDIPFSDNVKFTTGGMEDEKEEEEEVYEEQGGKKPVTSACLTLVVPPNDSKSSARLERQSSLELMEPLSMEVAQEQHRKERKTFSSRVSDGLVLTAWILREVEPSKHGTGEEFLGNSQDQRYEFFLLLCSHGRSCDLVHIKEGK